MEQGRKKPQDSDREQQIIAVCGLKAGCTNRIGIDAYDEYNDGYELKSTTKSGVSTARDVGFSHLEKWRTLNWICAKGIYDNAGIFQIEEIYFLRPWHLEPWFLRIEEKLRAREPLFEQILSLMNDSKLFSEIDVGHIQYVFKRGVLMNDPNIPWKFIREHGTDITRNPHGMLRQILQDSGPLLLAPREPVFKHNALSALFGNDEFVEVNARY